MKNGNFIDCGRMSLKTTSNDDYSYLKGVEGHLILGNDGRFYFYYEDESNQLGALVSSHVNSLDDVFLPISEEIRVKTKNSIYTFARKQKGGPSRG